MSNKKVKSVSFNITNQKEKEFLEMMETEKIEFATYVKELIFIDMERRNAPLKIVQRSKNGGIKIVVGSNTPPPSQEIV
ncbi:hypothetical protein V7152_15105 [Neobacillus drentensis]|uniref:hypothetical protein n=1 Tax=Neobacillus drentensis TaxID=220684 RepID=UPI002FFDCA5E